MLFNLSVRRAGIILGGVALAAAAIASTGPAAMASTAKPNVDATLCKTNGEAIYNDGGLQLWYSPSCRTAWAVIQNGIIGATLYVYNKNAGAEESTTINSEDRIVTAAVDDANTQSQACEYYVSTTSTNPHVTNICTAFY